MSTINERIKAIVDVYYNGNLSEFERICGLKAQTLKHVVKGRLSKPSFETIEFIVRTLPHINERWLITGEGEIIKEDHGKKIDNEEIRLQNIPEQDSRQIENLLEIIRVQSVQLSESQEQINKLLAIIEKQDK